MDGLCKQLVGTYAEWRKRKTQTGMVGLVAHIIILVRIQVLHIGNNEQKNLALVLSFFQRLTCNLTRLLNKGTDGFVETIDA